MKKYMFIILSMMMVMTVAGCSEASKEKSEPISEASESVTKAIDVIPNPEDIFSEGDVATIMTDPSAYYQVKNYKDGEYEEYVKACEEMGFTNVEHESESYGNKIFMAYDEDHEYYLEVSLVGQSQLIDIVCKEVEEK